MEDWHPGQEIVCINTEWMNGRVSVVPIKGHIYTIENIIDDGDEHGISFHLMEMKTINAWYHWHFKPLKKKKTDISAIIELLNPTPTKKKVLEDA
jgi:hypothetical protein